jgi:cysteine-rich repeat protein
VTSLFALILIINIVSAEEGKYYVFTLEITGSNLIFDNDSLSDPNHDFSFIFNNYSINMQEVNIIDSEEEQYYAPDYPTQDSTELTTKLISENGAELASKDFDSLLRFYYWELNISTEEEANKLNATIGNYVTFPYYSNATKIEIYYKGNKIYSYNFRQKLCNHNSICENPFSGNSYMSENYLSCPDDCAANSLDGYCYINTGISEYDFNDGICDFDCQHDTDANDIYGGECMKPGICGNKVVEGREECDDGNQINYDGCTSECKIEKCIDYDSSVSFEESLFVKSYVTDSGYFYDECVDNNSVREFYCGLPWYLFGDRIVKSTVRDCEYGCENGACLLNPNVNETLPPENETNQTIPQNTSNGLIAYYPFDENANDYSGNGNNGIVNNATLVEGVIGNAYDFNAYSTSSININKTLISNLSEYSLSMYFKRNISAPLFLDTIYSEDIIILFYYAHEIEIDRDADIITYSSPNLLNGWHSLVLTKNNQNYSLYIDGSLTANDIFASSDRIVNNAMIGNALSRYFDGSSSKSFKGTIDEFRVYNRILSESEIRSLYDPVYNITVSELPPEPEKPSPV